MSGFNDFMEKAGAIASKAAAKAKVLAAGAAGKTKDLAVAAAEKTKEVSRVAKLNMDISAQKDTIKKAYLELGKLYYEAHHDAPEGSFVQLCQEIDLANGAIAAMEEEIAQIKQASDQDAPVEDIDAVVEQTEAEAGVEVEITEEPAAPEEPAQPEEPAPEPEQPFQPEEPHQEQNWE